MTLYVVVFIELPYNPIVFGYLYIITQFGIEWNILQMRECAVDTSFLPQPLFFPIPPLLQAHHRLHQSFRWNNL